MASKFCHFYFHSDPIYTKLVKYHFRRIYAGNCNFYYFLSIFVRNCGYLWFVQESFRGGRCGGRCWMGWILGRLSGRLWIGGIGMEEAVWAMRIKSKVLNLEIIYLFLFIFIGPQYLVSWILAFLTFRVLP